ncbi:MAG: hypothetical protein RJA09_1619 [Pseudomonadota bacterium]|jgi:DNA-binding transcriptional LysR family regulator
MEFRHLRCLVVLAEELHFGRAAQRLAMTQPPLSLNIQQLEASVGAQLFVRNSRGVRLTPAGEALVPTARALLAQAAAAAQMAREAALGIRGRLQVGFAGTLLYRGLPQVLSQFQALYPQLTLGVQEMSSSDQLTDLLHDRLDVGFVHTTRVPSACSQIRVSSQPLVACLPADHPLAEQKALSPIALQPYPWAFITREVSPDYHDRILQWCAQAGLEPVLRYALRHWLSVVSVVSQGLSVALVPTALERSGMAGVVFRPLAEPTPLYDTHCLWKTDRDQGALGAFLGVVRQVAAGGGTLDT